MGRSCFPACRPQPPQKMALETTPAFAHRLIEVASQEKKIKTISLNVLDSVIVKARFKLDGKFVDVFYNSQTGTTAYSLIEKGKRVFGVDNTGGWHLHPKDKPDSHKKCKPITFEDFLTKALKD